MTAEIQSWMRHGPAARKTRAPEPDLPQIFDKKSADTAVAQPQKAAQQAPRLFSSNFKAQRDTHATDMPSVVFNPQEPKTVKQTARQRLLEILRD